jgi:RNA polymerase sigma factor (sigma-70 family)
VRPAADDPGSRPPDEIGRQVEDLFRREWGGLVAAVARLVRDLDLAEEIVQDTLTAALDRWPLGGVPEHPGGWLMTAARNRAFDHLRRQRRIDAKEAAIAYDIEARHAQSPSHEDLDPHGLADDRLRLIFTCCHPELARESQVALTLRLVAGLTTAEIARAFLSAEATIAQRLVRAKRLIRERDLPYGVPSAHELPARLAPVLAVLYLVFNEGYTAGAGDALLRPDLCEEALRLAVLVADLMPAEAEVLGLVSLMELQASRAAARADDKGAMVLLPDQDRTRWDRDGIERGLRHLARADALGRPGPYQLQAAIAACHARAASWGATDWRRIAALYAALQALTPSPVVELNLAVAVSMADGPAAALEMLDRLDAPALAQYHLLPATRADFLRRLGRWQEAAAEYRRALALTANRVEQDFLRGRVAECEARGGPSPSA